MTRETLRGQFRQQRLQLSPDLRTQHSIRIFSQFLQLLHFPIRQIFLYAPIHNEVETKSFFRWAQAEGIDCAYPRVEGDEMRFYEVKALDKFKAGPWGLAPQGDTVRKPDSETLILVPGVAFDFHCYRLGYGKAFYDRYLALHPEGFRLGLAYAFQICSDLSPYYSHDEQIDAVLCEQGLWGHKLEKAPPFAR